MSASFNYIKIVDRNSFITTCITSRYVVRYCCNSADMLLNAFAQGPIGKTNVIGGWITPAGKFVHDLWGDGFGYRILQDKAVLYLSGLINGTDVLPTNTEKVFQSSRKCGNLSQVGNLEDYFVIFRFLNLGRGAVLAAVGNPSIKLLFNGIKRVV